MRNIHDSVNIISLDGPVVRVGVDDQRRLSGPGPVGVEATDVGAVIDGFRVLEDVDVIGEGPVSRVDGGAGVEEEGFPEREGVSGVGGDVLHVADLGCGCWGLVEEDAADVDVLCGAACRWPVLVGGDVGF